MRSPVTRRRQRSARSVFILESNETVRFALEMLALACDKLRLVGSAPDLAAAASEIAELAPDLVISDIDFTGAGAFARVGELVQAQRGRAVLVLSQQEEERFARPVMALGARGYMMMSSAHQNCAQAALQILEGGTWLDAAVTRDAAGDQALATE